MDKRAEREAIDDLKRLYADFPPGEVDPDEEPDFVVRGPQSCVGIEVTEYFRPVLQAGAPPQEHESLSSRIVNAAAELWEQGDYPAALVNVAFDKSVRLAKGSVKSVAQDLVVLAAEHLKAGLTDPSVGAHRDLPNGVKSLVVYRYSKSAWTGSGTVWPEPISELELERLITGKDEKLAKYRAKCPEVWLLIVVSGKLSSASELQESFSTTFATGFNRVLLLFERHEVVRLR